MRNATLDVASWWAQPVKRRRTVVAVALVVVVAIAWGAVVGDSLDLTALSIAVATGFGAISSFQSAQMQRRQHTIDLLAAFQTADTLAASDAHVASLMRRTAHIDDDIDPEDDRYLINLLDYYEFISLSARNGHVDPATVVLLRGPAMVALWRCSSRYVTARRARYGPGLYAATEAFVTGAMAHLLPSEPAGAPPHGPA